jgi:hypothetical protein
MAFLASVQFGIPDVDPGDVSNVKQWRKVIAERLLYCI